RKRVEGGEGGKWNGGGVKKGVGGPRRSAGGDEIVRAAVLGQAEACCQKFGVISVPQQQLTTLPQAALAIRIFSARWLLGQPHWLPGVHCPKAYLRMAFEDQAF